MVCHGAVRHGYEGRGGISFVLLVVIELVTDAQRQALRAELDRIENDPDDQRNVFVDIIDYARRANATSVALTRRLMFAIYGKLVEDRWQLLMLTSIGGWLKARTFPKAATAEVTR